MDLIFSTYFLAQCLQYYLGGFDYVTVYATMTPVACEPSDVIWCTLNTK